MYAQRMHAQRTYAQKPFLLLEIVHSSQSSGLRVRHVILASGHAPRSIQLRDSPVSISRSPSMRDNRAPGRAMSVTAPRLGGADVQRGSCRARRALTLCLSAAEPGRSSERRHRVGAAAAPVATVPCRCWELDRRLGFGSGTSPEGSRVLGAANVVSIEHGFVDLVA
jgi:hypothetical protein